MSFLDAWARLFGVPDRPTQNPEEEPMNDEPDTAPSETDLTGLSALAQLMVVHPPQEIVWAVLYPTGAWGAMFMPHQHPIAQDRARQLQGMLVALPVVADFRPESIRPPLADVVIAGTPPETGPESVPAATTEDAVAAVREALSWALLDPAERSGDPEQDAADHAMAKQVLGEDTYRRIAALRDATAEVECPGCGTVIRAPVGEQHHHPKLSGRTLRTAVEALNQRRADSGSENYGKASADIQRHLRERAARKATKE